MDSLSSRVKKIIERHPLSDKELQETLGIWLVELSEEISESVVSNVEARGKLSTKRDIKMLISLMNSRFEAIEKANAVRFEALQREQMALRQEMDARFEVLQREQMALRQEMDARFEAINQRFEQMEKANAARFEAINQRFEAINQRFEQMEKANAARFEAINQRFEQMEKANAARFEAINQRFEAINQRFEALEKRLTFIQWLIGGGVATAILGLLLVALKLFFPQIFPK